MAHTRYGMLVPVELVVPNVEVPVAIVNKPLS
jgi:hypothetical protein